MKRTLAAARRLIPLLRAGLISGVVVAAVTYPLAAVGGLGAKAGVDYYQSLPSELNVVPPSQTTYVYANDGKTLMTMFYEEHRRYTPLPEISENIVNAIVASEDSRFYEHNGVDTKGIVRAFVANHSSGEVSQGASTLTMQYVRASLRDSAQTPAEVQQATEQTSARKLREMRLAISLEKQLSKRDILERYLNVAYFGHRAYGIFAAAQIFFSKLPKDLTVIEAATLAGLVKAPSAYDPAASDPRAATDRRNYVIEKMRELGYITAADAEKAKAQPIKLNITVPPNDCVSVPKNNNSWGFFCDFFKTWWTEQPAFGNSAAEREDKLRRGGYRVVTSLDPRIQKIAQKHVSNQVSSYSSFGHGIVVLKPGTGQVRAMGVNRVYSLDQKGNGRHSDPDKAGKIKGNYPNTVNPLLGGGDIPGYQAGSTFKIFTAVAALHAGMPLTTSFYAPHRYTSKYWTAWNDPRACHGGHWCPQNASGAMTGKQNMWTGFGKSVNTYFVQLEQKVGADKAVKMAENLGLRWRSDVDKMMATYPRSKTWGAFTLGVSDVTPLEMANAYATMAADGKYCEPLPVQTITTAQGKPAMWTPPGKKKKPVEVAKPRCRQAVSEQVARAFTDIARCVTGYGAAKGACGSWSTAPSMYRWTERPIAGKTGTTDDTRAAWFVGYTPQLAAASFMSDPDNPFHVVGDWNYNVPLLTVAHTLKEALEGQPKQSFSAPSGKILGNPSQRMEPRSSARSTPHRTVKPKKKRR